MNQKIKELLQPGIRLFAICAVAALVLGFVNELTGPKIDESKAEEDRKALAKLVEPGEALGEARSAFPMQMTKQDFEEKILSGCTTVQRTALLDFFSLSGDEGYALQTGLSDEERNNLSLLLKEIGFVSKADVRGWYTLEKAGKVSGYVLELAGNGFGGYMKLFAAYDREGSVKNAVLVEAAESPAQKKKAEDESYMTKFMGTRGMGIPTIKGMLSTADADAVSGASITFMGISGALRAGSLWIIALEAE